MTTGVPAGATTLPLAELGIMNLIGLAGPLPCAKAGSVAGWKSAQGIGD
jgi:hypothetical protein